MAYQYKSPENLSQLLLLNDFFIHMDSLNFINVAESAVKYNQPQKYLTRIAEGHLDGEMISQLSVHIEH